MKILIDIGHPAHVHLFKNLSNEMLNRGHKVLFTCRDKEFEIDLLRSNNLSFKSFGKKYHTKLGKLWGLIEFDAKQFLVSLKFKPDIFLSHGSIYAAHVAFLLRKPHISLEDTFNFEQIKLYLPFTRVVLTGDYEHPPLGKKEINFAGYHELAYLHPNYFAPDKTILDSLGVKVDEKYVILRFVALKATHDHGDKGITQDYKFKAVYEFKKYAHVFISSEVDLPDELQQYKLQISPERIHHAMAFASLVFGESSTMAEESAMLGIPAIYVSRKGTYYTTHLEKDYGLLFNFNDTDSGQVKAIEKGIEILKSAPDAEHSSQRSILFSEKIDVTAFLIWFVENYPVSVSIIRSQPDYQYRFK